MPGQRGTAIYNKYCGGGTAAAPAAPATLNPALSNAVQSLGYSLGQQLGNTLFGGGNKAAKPPIQPLIDPAQQQREFAAQQLNNSGLYFLRQKTSGGAIAAINEFQKALGQTPNDTNILHNLALAKQQLKDITAAGQTSGALGQVLGTAPPVNTGLFGDQLTHGSIPSPNASALSLVNLDPNVVDFRGVGRQANSSGTVLDSDPHVVDLRGLRGSAANASWEKLTKQQDEEDLQKRQALDGLFTNNAPASAPPAKLVTPIEGAQQNKAQVKPAPDPDAMMKKIFDLNNKSE